MSAAHLVAATVPHRFIGQRGDQPAMHESARVGVWRREPEAQDDRIRRLPRIDRLPRIGERTAPGLAFETLGDVGRGHAFALQWLRPPLNAIIATNAPHTKFKTYFGTQSSSVVITRESG